MPVRPEHAPEQLHEEYIAKVNHAIGQQRDDVALALAESFESELHALIHPGDLARDR